MYRSRRVATVVLARAAARRLPGKMLLPFGEGTVLSSAIERLRACTLADEIVLATTESSVLPLHAVLPSWPGSLKKYSADRAQPNPWAAPPCICPST